MTPDRVEAGEGLVVHQQRGSRAMVRASATRRAMPPDSSPGISRAAPARPTAWASQDQIVDQLGRQVGVLPQRKGHVVEHRHVGEQGTELEQHAHAPTQA